jgi:hypothetical protein
MRTMLDCILSKVGGSITRVGLQELVLRANEVPEVGLVLDLSPGEGRSSIAIATALEECDNNSAKVISVDTHVTNPLSKTAQEEGTLALFFRHAREFRVLHRITTIVDSIGVIPQIFNKRSANLVVVQVSALTLNIEDGLDLAIKVAQFAVRRSGRIIIIAPPQADPSGFSRFVASRFTEGFKALADTSEYKVFECGEDASTRPSRRLPVAPSAE